MKNKLLIVILSFIFIQSVQAQTTKSFIISATVPAATSVGITVNKVTTASNQWAPVTATQLSFDPLTFDAANGIYLPQHFFAVDVTPQNGSANNMQTDFSYVEGTNPNKNGHGLGWKSTITFVKTSGSGTTTTDTPLSSHGKKLLKDLTGESIVGTETQGGWLRAYLGTVTGDPAAQEPTGAEPFSGADAPGTYQGQLTVTSTLL